MHIRPPRIVATSVAVLFGALAGLAQADPPQAVGAHVQAAITHRVSAFVHRASAAVSHITAVHHRQPAPPTQEMPRAPAPRPLPPESTDHATNAGIVEGHVISIDYQSGMIGIMTPDRGKVNVMVLPSTNIQGQGDSFHTIADIGRGSRLRVFMSERAGQLFAQIIHLR